MGDPAQFQGRIVFMSMFNDIISWNKDNETECVATFPAARWSFLGLGSETKWHSTYIDRPRGEWGRVAELMMIKLGESKHPVFRATSPLSRGTLKNKGSGKFSFHLCADLETIETIFRTIISINGAISDLCEEWEDSGGERVTAKSKPMMHFVLRCSEKILSCLTLLHQKTLGKPEEWTPSKNGKLVEDAYSSSYSEWNADERRFSQEWNSDEVTEVRTERLVNEQSPCLSAQHTDRFIVDDEWY